MKLSSFFPCLTPVSLASALTSVVALAHNPICSPESLSCYEHIDSEVVFSVGESLDDKIEKQCFKMECYERLLACGDFKHLKELIMVQTTDGYLSLDEHYFLGVAAYSLDIEGSSSESFCQNGEVARTHLKSYLTSQSESFSKGEIRSGKTQVYIQDALLKLKELNRRTDCPCVEHSQNYQTLLLEKIIGQKIEEINFSQATSPLMQEAKNNIKSFVRDTLGSLMAKLSDLTSFVTLSEVEASSARRILKNIKQKLDSIGEVATFADSIREELISPLKSLIEEKEAEIKAKIGAENGSSQEAFEFLNNYKKKGQAEALQLLGESDQILCELLRIEKSFLANKTKPRTSKPTPALDLWLQKRGI
ncbi:MAG: hypothetical protein HYW48_07875 [Deltaproteobacteria bacterium]|nr:hypothetical protein [Deltaproteobacteria bacterium]